DHLGDVGRSPSIALDDRGGIHIAYLVYDGGVRYAARAGADAPWRIQDIGVAFAGAVDVELAIDSSHPPNVLYVDAAGGAFHGRRSDSGAWTFDPALTVAQRARGELHFDEHGRLHAALAGYSDL